MTPSTKKENLTAVDAQNLSGARRDCEVVHFHSSDDRFCGCTKQLRRFSLNPNEITCDDCKGRDAFVLSPSGRAFLQSLGYAQ